MKRYKLKKDLLSFKAGNPHIREIHVIYDNMILVQPPSEHPDWFEEIKEPSDEEVLAQFLFNNHFKPPQNEYRSILWGVLHDANKEQYFLMAKALIEKGFNVDFLRKEEL